MDRKTSTKEVKSMTEKENLIVRRLPIPGGHGRSIKIAEGQCIAVRDIEGGQCGDFWAVDAGDLNHFLSPSHTFVHIGRIQPRIGDELVTNRREPILTGAFSCLYCFAKATKNLNEMPKFRICSNKRKKAFLRKAFNS
jgi:uncharacterized protein YcgI (DUF1989 family)